MSQVCPQHSNSERIKIEFYSNFYCGRVVMSSSGRKGMHRSVLSVQPQMCQSSKINDAISGISCCIIFGSSQQFGKIRNSKQHHERFCYTFHNQYHTWIFASDDNIYHLRCMIDMCLFYCCHQRYLQ